MYIYIYTHMRIYLYIPIYVDIHIHICDIYRHHGNIVLRRLRQSETERQVFHSNVAEEACRRAVLFVLCDESLWLVDMQWLRLEKKTAGI